MCSCIIKVLLWHIIKPSTETPCESVPFWHLIQKSKCGVQKKVKPEIVPVSGLSVQAPMLDDEGDEFSFVSGQLQVQACFISQLAWECFLWIMPRSLSSEGCSLCRGAPWCACWCTAGLPVLKNFSTAVSLCSKQDVCQFCCSYFVWLITFPMFLLGLGWLPFS